MTTLDLEFLSAERFADRTAISALLENGAALETFPRSNRRNSPRCFLRRRF